MICKDIFLADVFKIFYQLLPIFIKKKLKDYQPAVAIKRSSFPVFWADAIV
jgi:hypothetical protein